MIQILNAPSATLSLGIALVSLSLLTSSHALDGAGTVNATLDAGWVGYEVVTSGDDISAVDAPGYGTTMTRTIFDGLGAYVTGNTLQVYVNHETTPASISRVDLDLTNFQQSVTNTLAGSNPPFAGVVSQIGLAYDAIYDGTGSLVVSGFAAVNTYGNNNFSRFCSGGVHLPDAFGAGSGFVDALYVTGEEVSAGKAYALDCATSDLWEISAFGSHPWENFAPIDTGNTTHTAMAIWADSSGGELMMIYVGEKNPSGDFLARNGLRGGTVYYFDPVAGGPNGNLPDGTEDFVLTTNTNDAETVTKLEDIHTNPADGKQLVFGAQNNGLYIMDVDIQFDGSGNVVTGLGGSTVSVSQTLNDNNAISTFDNPDNVTWSPSGHIYVQEDGGNSPGHEIWKLSPSDPIGTLTRVGQGNTETSGIIDVSAMTGFPHDTVYLFSIQGGSGTAQLVTLVNTEACPAFGAGIQVGTATDNSLSEISGLVVSSQNPGVLWVHNDKNNPAEIYALSSNGSLLGTYTLQGVADDPPNNIVLDFEDIAIGPGPVQGVNYLYIADTGDNASDRDPLVNPVTIYRVPEPDIGVQPNGVLTGVEAFPVSYPGQPQDCETLLVDPLSGDIVIVTRDRTSGTMAHVFSYPASSQIPNVTFTLELKSSHDYPDDIKGGDVSKAGDMVILRSSVNGAVVDGLLWNRPPGTPLWSVFGDPFCTVPLAGEPQGEAVGFNADGSGYYTISEGANQPVYFYSSSGTPPLPAAPIGLAASAGDDSVSLTWQDNTEPALTGYNVYRSPTSGSGHALIANVTNSDYVDTGVINGTTYFYVVSALDSFSQESTVSTEASATPADVTAPTVNLTTANPTVTGSFDVNVIFSEPVTGLDLLDFSITNGNGDLLSGSSANYTLGVTPTNFGLITILLPAGSTTDGAGNGNLQSNTLQVTYEDPSAPTPYFATSESTNRGSVSGSLTDTHNSDNVYQALTEVSSGGKPSRRYSQLQHTWTINVSGSNPVLVVEAYHNDTSSGDGDDFILSYSTDNSNFTDVITISKISDDDAMQSASLGNISGTVYIRVVDTNHDQGTNTFFDTLFVDHLFIETSSGGGNTFPTFNSDPVVEASAIENQPYTTSTLADDAMDADGDQLIFSKLSGPAWLTVASDGALSGTPTTGDLGLNVFSVEVNDANGGTASASLEISVQPVGGSLDMSVGSIVMSFNALNGNRYSGVASVTVLDQTGSAVSGATVSASWTGATSQSQTGVTNGSGVAVFESKKVKNGGTFTITINDVTAAGFNYVASGVTTGSVTAP